MEIVSISGLIVMVIVTIACPLIAHNKVILHLVDFRQIVSRRTGLNYRQLLVKQK